VTIYIRIKIEWGWGVYTRVFEQETATEKKRNMRKRWPVHWINQQSVRRDKTEVITTFTCQYQSIFICSN